MNIAALTGSALLLVGTLVVPQAASAQAFNALGRVTKVVTHGGKQCPFSEGQTFEFYFQGVGIYLVFPNAPHGPAGTIVGNLPAVPTAPATKWDGTYQAETIWNGGTSGVWGPNKFTATLVLVNGVFVLGNMTLQDFADYTEKNACDVTIEYAAVC